MYGLFKHDHTPTVVLLPVMIMKAYLCIGLTSSVGVSGALNLEEAF